MNSSTRKETHHDDPGKDAVRHSEPRRPHRRHARGPRVYADDPPMPGDRLELELFLPDQSEVVCTVEVVWVDGLPDGSPARYDVGVKFVSISPADRERLSVVLKSD